MTKPPEQTHKEILEAQQAFLLDAKATLGLKWNELAAKIGAKPGTLATWHLPPHSAKKMSNVAKTAIQNLLKEKS